MAPRHRYKDIEGSRREFNLEVPAEEVKRRLDIIYDEINKTVQIPGFRKGKAPRDILEKYHKDAAREKALGELVSDSYREAVRESNTAAVGLPSISEVEFKDGISLSFKAAVDIKPKIALADYKNLKVPKRLAEVKDGDVDKYISLLRESYARYESAGSRQARAGDIVICDAACAVGGRYLYKDKKNMQIALDKELSLPELADGLAGASKGEAKEIRAVLPENPDKPEYSKKEAIFRIKINDIKEKELPEINDEFAKTHGGYKSVAELRDAVRKDIIRKEESRIREEAGNQILEMLLKNSSVPPPRGLVDGEAGRIFEDTINILLKKGVKKEALKSREGDIRDNAKKEADRRVKIYFLLDEIARIEDIKVSDAEVGETLGLLARASDTTKEALRKRYIDNGLLGGLINQLKENKVIEFLLSRGD